MEAAAHEPRARHRAGAGGSERPCAGLRRSWPMLSAALDQLGGAVPGERGGDPRGGADGTENQRSARDPMAARRFRERARDVARRRRPGGACITSRTQRSNILAAMPRINRNDHVFAVDARGPLTYRTVTHALRRRRRALAGLTDVRLHDSAADGCNRGGGGWCLRADTSTASRPQDIERGESIRA